MKLLKKILFIKGIIFCFSLFLFNPGFSQTSCTSTSSGHCGDITVSGNGHYYMVPEPCNVDFVFDNMSKYVRGITYSGATTIKLDIHDGPTPPCKWKLIMYVVNGTAAARKWDGTPYDPASTEGVLPSISALKVRVYNSCGTPINNAVFQNFTIADSAIDIIHDIASHLPGPAGCNTSTQVNTAGSYQTNYGEYSFYIDYFIKPKLDSDFKPGNYNLTIKFCLAEDN